MYFSILFVSSLVSAAPSVSLSDLTGLASAAFIAGTSLIKYYDPNPSGSIYQNSASDSSGVQWYESGILWETLLRNAQASGNREYVPVITGALVNASYGTAGSFLGPPSLKNSMSVLLNQWNDDIGMVETQSNDSFFKRGGGWLDLVVLKCTRLLK